MTDGVVLQRVKVGAWLVTEDRDRAFDGSRRSDNPLHERTRIRVPLLTLDVRLTQQFGLQIGTTIPDVTRTAVVNRADGTFNFRENFRGLGDTFLLGWYRFKPHHGWNVVANVGASLPTGKTEEPRFQSELDAGSLVPRSRLQRGSGTVDPLFGVNVDRRLRGATLFASVAARAPLTENKYGLRTGASWEVGSGLARELGSHRVVLYARTGWLHREQDVFKGVPVLVGGGDWLSVAPGVAVQVGKGVTAQAEVKFPLYRALSNRQLDSAAVFQFGVSRAF